MAAGTGPDVVDLYVYYRVRDTDASAYRAQAGALLAALHQQSGVQGRLSRRPEAKEGLHTWMESFLDVPLQHEAAVHSHLADPRTTHFQQGGRHLERFEHMA